ncbi:hypothetical protein [Myceligenerans indicum]|uniref:Uncharacterized protein n=1 Tax=Myceligenerans indicum TaxID=2593663 RepID=A0ABS1LLL7_9MICO|nr:hypothetical protein [Myceligenerans indicum]MBL0886914.1 hypothetical protein [Myceligenerans indicum]
MEHSHDDAAGPTSNRRRLGRVIEASASVGAVLGIVLMLHNHLSAYLCFFGAYCMPDDGEIVTYRVLAVTTVVLVVVATVAGVYNHRRRLLAWHGLVAAAVVVALVLFAVPQIRWDRPGSPVRNFENGEQCYTGGTGFCQGG